MSYSERERLEAAHWFLDIHDAEDPSAELLQEWMRWMDASEAHRAAFAAVEEAWRRAGTGLAARGTASAPRRDDYDGEIGIDEWNRRRAAVHAGRRRSVAWRPALWMAAAVITAIALIVPLWQSLPADGAQQRFATRTGEQMQVTLPDGSQVNLGPRSRLSVAYSASVRTVRLETGEAFFTVQKDAARPFRVHVLDGVVTAVGTKFDVRRINDRVLVAVAEGAVQINGGGTRIGEAVAHTGSGAALRHAARLRRGEAINFSGGDTTSLAGATVTRVDPGEPARWREGWLVYRDESLHDVLADIGRYTDRDIVIAEPLSGEARFTGAVFKDSILEWLQSLPAAFPVTVRIDGSRVTISSSTGPVLAHK